MSKIQSAQTIHGRPFDSPDLLFNDGGGLIEFLDLYGHRVWIEIRENELYVVWPGRNRMFRLREPDTGTIKTFNVIGNITKTDFQNAGFAYQMFTIKNNLSSPALFKVKQEDGTHLLGTSSFYQSLMGNDIRNYITLADHQKMSSNDQDLIIEVNGTTDVTIYTNLIQMF